MAKNFESGKSGETVLGALASDDTPRHAKLDTITHTLQTIDYAHHEVHSGSHFFFTYPFTLAATTDTQSIMLDTPDTTVWSHMTFDLGGSAITEVWVYEDSSIANTTDYLTPYNNNRNSTDSASLVISNLGDTGVTTTDTGTIIWHTKSGASSQQSRQSMQGGNTEEIILKQNSLYRIHFETGTATNLCNLKLEWYEHQNKV
jgi:hypothetical protein